MSTRADRIAHINNIGGCVNPYDVLTYAGVPFDQWITEGSGIMDGHSTWKLANAGPLPPQADRKNDRARSNSFAKLAKGRPFVRMTFGRMDAWITADAAETVKAANVPLKDGKRIKFSAPGLPCETMVNSETGLAAIGASRPCGRPIEDGTNACSMHNKVEAKRAERSAAWDAERAANRAADQRERETRRRAEELVAEAADLLEQLGYRPDTVTISRSGLIKMPSEMFADMLRRAAEQADMERMGL